MADKKSEKEVPETLIKYYACNEYSYDALKNNYLWASHPEQFNDPFDCSPKLWDADSFTIDKVSQFINIENDPKHQEFLGSRDGLFKLMHVKIGIICLNSGNKGNDDLFWGYYSNQKGFAVEFYREKLSEDLKLNINARFYQVKYFVPDDFMKYRVPSTWGKFKHIIIDSLRQKKRIWEHENEFRYIFQNCDFIPSANLGNSETRKKHYSSDAVLKVILGLKFFGECREIIDGENEAFIYNLIKESNPYHYKLLKHLIENPKYSLWWMFQNENLSLEQIPIKLSYLDPWNIIIKVENGGYFYPFFKQTKN